MQNITFETLQNGNIEPCRALCNALMAFQKSKAHFEAERFDTMNFDTRMKKSYDSALDKQVVLVKNQGVPVGYVFSTIESLDNMKRSPLQLLPAWEHLPEKIGCLSQLYLKEECRGTGIGSRLFETSMQWLTSFDDVDLIFIFISNGNDDAYHFYLKHGFVFSHDVLGGFIKAVYKRVER